MRRYDEVTFIPKNGSKPNVTNLLKSGPPKRSKDKQQLGGLSGRADLSTIRGMAAASPFPLDEVTMSNITTSAKPLSPLGLSYALRILIAFYLIERY